MTIHEDLLQAIDQNLSKEVGTRLQQVLLQGEEDAVRVESLIGKNTSQAAKNADLEVQLKDYEALRVTKKNMDDRILECAILADRLELERALCCSHRNDLMLMWSQAFAAPSVQERMFTLSGSLNGYDKNGSITGTLNASG